MYPKIELSRHVLTCKGVVVVNGRISQWVVDVWFIIPSTVASVWGISNNVLKKKSPTFHLILRFLSILLKHDWLQRKAWDAGITAQDFLGMDQIQTQMQINLSSVMCDYWCHRRCSVHWPLGGNSCKHPGAKKTAKGLDFETLKFPPAWSFLACFYYAPPFFLCCWVQEHLCAA